MSGGKFDYRNDMLCEDIFDGLYPEYGIGDESQVNNAKRARKVNPFEDSILSELVYDMFCLIHSLDWYHSGDISEITYRLDVREFKDKWLTMPSKKLAERTIKQEIADLEERLKRELSLDEHDD